ncbi:hypothetical protein PTKIN_Ptkin18bG0048400 [Pterospermum kingtungense]
MDAALFVQKGKTGVGMVLRNVAREFMVACALVMEGCLPVREAEAIGVLEALSWIYSLGLDKVIIETDAKAVVDSFSVYEEDGSEFGSIISCYKTLLRSGVD